jgi:asparagine synthase (glutamine-hydrolysing)
LGHTFISDCDTEVLVHLYEEYKENMLTMLDGMFAFIIFDTATNNFLMARDRYGIKPLYYAEADNSIYVSSELKSFTTIDEIYEYKELLPSCYMDDSGISRYYFQSYDVDDTISFESALSTAREYVIDAVKKRVDTDLPIGMWLSGGIDSSIVFLIARKYHKNIVPIIIGKDNSEDVEAAKFLCDQVKSSYVHINPSDDEIFRNIPNLIECIETFEPNPIRPSALTWFLAEKANCLGLKVVLCGEGGDEIFGGYGDFLFSKSDDEFKNLTCNFVENLYRTQLLRIDRVGMAFHVEVREPFMDNRLVDYAVRLNPSYKIGEINGKKVTKYILREAFKEILPPEIYIRNKKTIMAGADIGNVEPAKGVFYENAQKKQTKKESQKIKEKYNEYDL